MRTVIALCGLLLVAGCASYHVGARALYAPDVSTVYVPMIESDSFRPHLAERLTEAVVKEIELKTPFKVVASSDADSVLACKIASDSKHVVIENFFDETRQLDLNLRAEVSWVNRRREPLRSPAALELPAELLVFNQSAVLIPEVGQSVAVSQQQAIERLAEQIVATMEAPW